jgi:hypothetical protein
MMHHQLAIDLVEDALAELHGQIAIVDGDRGGFIGQDAFEKELQLHFDGIDLFGFGYVVGDVLFGVVCQLYLKLVFLIRQ